MADVTIDATVETSMDSIAKRGGPFWTTALIGYVVYSDDGGELVYQKTTDGGANWGGQVEVAAGDMVTWDCWADWQTDGDAGTKIHIVYIDVVGDDIRYVYLDTNGDSVGGDDLIEAAQGNGTIATGVGPDDHIISITKTRGGNIAVAARYLTDASYEIFYTSPDATTWTSKTSPWETALDYLQLYPANLADSNDLWATFWDIDSSPEEITLKTFDNSGNSWSEVTITGVAGAAHSSTYLQMDGQIRLSDGHLILAQWNRFDHINAHFLLWDITDAGTITRKTDILNNAAETFLVSVFINQVNDDIYVVYASGTTIQFEVAVFYQVSDDGGGTWGGETAMQADAEDDERWVSAGCMKAAWGGKFQPFWFNDDLNDIFTNTDNGISIAASAAGWSHKFLGVANAAIGKINGVAIAGIVKVNGVA